MQLTELQEEEEEILDTLQAMEFVLSDIEETLRYKQRTRHRRLRQQKLEVNLAKVNIQLWVTCNGKRTDRQFIDTESKIKQIDNYIFEAMNQRSFKARSALTTNDKYIEEHDTLHHVAREGKA